MKDMTEQQRLELIVEVVRWCQRMRALGMPRSCYTKALRESVFYLWTTRNGSSKEKLARYRSRASLGIGHGNS